MILLLYLNLIQQLDVAPFISGENLETGVQLSLGFTERTSFIVAVFLSARCPCSASHEAAIQELSVQYKSKGFQFLGIHSNANEDEMSSREYFRRSMLRFPIIQDVGAKLANRFGALKTPHVFVFNRNGKIEYQGAVDNSHRAENADIRFLADALSDLSLGKEVRVKESRSLGCLIERP